MTTQTFAVTGMTCEHCVRAVSEEISALAGVNSVDVALDAAGSSRVTVVGDVEVSTDHVAAALDEAGDYHLA